MPGLTIDSLRLAMFRSHTRTDLALDGRPVAIFGANGAGKTNILEAVSLLSPGRGLRRAATEELIRRPDQVGWKVRADVTRGGSHHEVETFSEPGSPRKVLIDGKSATQTALGHLVPVVWLVPSMDRLWIEGAEGRRRFLDRAVLSFDPEHAEAVLAYEKAMRQRNRLLKDQVMNDHWYKALEARMAEAGARIQTARQATLARLASAQDQAETAFPAATLSLEAANDEPEPADEPTLRVAFATSRPQDMRAGRTLVGPHRADLGAIYADKEVPAAQCSTGEQKALLISLILANARALATDVGAPPVVVLDEVSAHLDADRRRALYDEICALGAQAWMTGTGPELFADLGDRAQRFEVTEDGTSSRLRET